MSAAQTAGVAQLWKAASEFDVDPIQAEADVLLPAVGSEGFQARPRPAYQLIFLEGGHGREREGAGVVRLLHAIHKQLFALAAGTLQGQYVLNQGLVAEGIWLVYRAVEGDLVGMLTYNRESCPLPSHVAHRWDGTSRITGRGGREVDCTLLHIGVVMTAGNSVCPGLAGSLIALACGIASLPSWDLPLCLLEAVEPLQHRAYPRYGFVCASSCFREEKEGSRARAALDQGTIPTHPMLKRVPYVNEDDDDEEGGGSSSSSSTSDSSDSSDSSEGEQEAGVPVSHPSHRHSSVLSACERDEDAWLCRQEAVPEAASRRPWGKVQSRAGRINGENAPFPNGVQVPQAWSRFVTYARDYLHAHAGRRGESEGEVTARTWQALETYIKGRAFAGEKVDGDALLRKLEGFRSSIVRLRQGKGGSTRQLARPRPHPRTGRGGALDTEGAAQQQSEVVVDLLEDSEEQVVQILEDEPVEAATSREGAMAVAEATELLWEAEAEAALPTTTTTATTSTAPTTAVPLPAIPRAVSSAASAPRVHPVASTARGEAGQAGAGAGTDSLVVAEPEVLESLEDVAQWVSANGTQKKPFVSRSGSGTAAGSSLHLPMAHRSHPCVLALRHPNASVWLFGVMANFSDDVRIRAHRGSTAYAGRFPMTPLVCRNWGESLRGKAVEGGPTCRFGEGCRDVHPAKGSDSALAYVRYKSSASVDITTLPGTPSLPANVQPGASWSQFTALGAHDEREAVRIERAHETLVFCEDHMLAAGGCKVGPACPSLHVAHGSTVAREWAHYCATWEIGGRLASAVRRYWLLPTQPFPASTRPRADLVSYMHYFFREALGPDIASVPLPPFPQLPSGQGDQGGTGAAGTPARCRAPLRDYRSQALLSAEEELVPSLAGEQGAQVDLGSIQYQTTPAGDLLAPMPVQGKAQTILWFYTGETGRQRVANGLLADLEDDERWVVGQGGRKRWVAVGRPPVLPVACQFWPQCKGGCGCYRVHARPGSLTAACDALAMREASTNTLHRMYVMPPGKLTLRGKVVQILHPSPVEDDVRYGQPGWDVLPGALLNVCSFHLIHQCRDSTATDAGRTDMSTCKYLHIRHGTKTARAAAEAIASGRLLPADSPAWQHAALAWYWLSVPAGFETGTQAQGGTGKRKVEEEVDHAPANKRVCLPRDAVPPYVAFLRRLLEHPGAAQEAALEQMGEYREGILDYCGPIIDRSKGTVAVLDAKRPFVAFLCSEAGSVQQQQAAGAQAGPVESGTGGGRAGSTWPTLSNSTLHGILMLCMQFPDNSLPSSWVRAAFKYSDASWSPTLGQLLDHPLLCGLEVLQGGADRRAAGWVAATGVNADSDPILAIRPEWLSAAQAVKALPVRLESAWSCWPQTAQGAASAAVARQVLSLASLSPGHTLPMLWLHACASAHGTEGHEAGAGALAQALQHTVDAVVAGVGDGRSRVAITLKAVYHDCSDVLLGPFGAE